MKKSLLAVKTSRRFLIVSSSAQSSFSLRKSHHRY